MSYRFKQAGTEEEFDQIARLNHAVFAAELGQYGLRPDGALADKFHARNTYFIALHAREVVGMVAVNAAPPYSIAEKMTDPGVLDELGQITEVRLLAIKPEHRKGAVLRGLLWPVLQFSRRSDTLVISGRVEEQAMYRKLGFVPLGPAVASGGAMFIPMMAPIQAILRHARERWAAPTTRGSSAASDPASADRPAAARNPRISALR